MEGWGRPPVACARSHCQPPSGSDSTGAKSTEPMFDRIRVIGTLLGRDCDKILARATSLREAEGAAVALAFLRANLEESPAKIEARQLDSYLKCRILLGECQAECGLREQKLDLAWEGIHQLLQLARENAPTLKALGSILPGLLGKAEELLRAFLSPDWPATGDRNVFLPELATLTEMWNQLEKPQQALRICLLGLEYFPTSARLLLLKAEAHAGLKETPECVVALRAAVRAETSIPSPALAIALLDMAQASPEPRTAAEASAVAAEVYARLGRWDQAYTSGRHALAALGRGLEDPSFMALLTAMARHGKLNEFIRDGTKLLQRGASEAALGALLAESRRLFELHPDHWDLLCLAGAVHLRSGRYAEAIDAFKQSLAGEESLAPTIVEWHRVAGTYDTTDPALCLQLADALFWAGDTDACLTVLSRLADAPAAPEQVAEAIARCNHVFRKLPQSPQAALLLGRLLLRDGEPAAALEHGLSLLAIPEAAPAVVELGRHIHARALAAGDAASALAALRLRIEAEFLTGSLTSAFEGLATLEQDPQASADDLAWAAGRLQGVATQAGSEALVLLGDLYARTRGVTEAAEAYLAALEQEPSAATLERVLLGLEPVWTSAPDAPAARAALATGWLRLGRPQEARAALLESLAQGRPEGPALLETVRAQAAKVPADPQWTRLRLEAEIAAGSEENLAAATEALRRLIRENPDCYELVQTCAPEIAAKTRSPATTEAVRLLQAETFVARRDFAALEAMTLDAVGAGPGEKVELARAIEEAARTLDAASQAQVYILAARLLATTGTAEAGTALSYYERAAELDLATWGDVVVAETSRLVSGEGHEGAAVLSAARTALRLGKPAQACEALLRTFPELGSQTLLEARRFAQQVLREHPQMAPALLVEARCAARTGQIQEALRAWRTLSAMSGEALAALARRDLAALHEQEPANGEVFLAYADSLVDAGEATRARDKLLEAIPRYPDQGPPILERLRGFQARPERGWEDLVAVAEALRLTGQPELALPLWSQVLAHDHLDWERCARGLRQLAIALPKDPQCGALLVRAESQALPPDKAGEAVRQLDRVLALDPLEGDLLIRLLEDCAVLERKVVDREDWARAVATRRARIQMMRGDHIAAANAWDQVARSWPNEARKVATRCLEQFNTTGAAAYLRPLARARFTLGDFPGGAEAVRQHLTACPGELGSARELCEEYAPQAGDEGREAIELLRLTLARQSGDLAQTARLATALANTLPTAIPRVRALLESLIAEGTRDPAVHLALAEVLLAQGDDRLEEACTVARRFAVQDPDRNLGVVATHLRDLKKRLATRLEPRRHLITLFLELGPRYFTELELEARELLGAFGAEGARQFLELCGPGPELTTDQIPLWRLKAEAADVAGDLPGALACLTALKTIDRHGQAGFLRERAGAHQARGDGLPRVLPFLGDLARETQDLPGASSYYAEAVELPEVDLELLRHGLELILEADPQQGRARCALARCAWKAGAAAEAARHYHLAGVLLGLPAVLARLRELCAAFPTVPQCPYVLGSLAFDQGSKAEAFACLGQALAQPGLEPAERIQALKRFAECHAAEHRYDDAVSALREVLATDATDDTAARRLIRLYFERNAHKRQCLREAMSRKGESAELMAHYGELLEAEGDYTGALQWFQRVPRDCPLTNDVLTAMGRCRLRLNQANLAVTAFSAVLANRPSPTERFEALYQLGLAYARLLEFQRAVDTFRELCIEDPGYRDAGEQLRRCYDELHAGDVFRLAPVPFDLLAAWRDHLAAAETRPAASLPPSTSH